MSVDDVGALVPPGAPRPSGVPLETTWNDREGVWELAIQGADGRRAGLMRAWRSDGTLAAEYTYRDDERDGPFRRFHPDGAVAREGRYVRGQFHGTVVAHGYAGSTPEPMQSCCVPETAWQLQHDYEHGRFTDARWYDRAGVHILPNGAPHPVRPPGVPREARYEEKRQQWVLATYSDAAKFQGVWQRWAVDGVLRERDEYDDGKADGLWQRFDAAGALVEEGHWRAGQRDGGYRRIGVPALLYTDALIHEERGAFARDQSVGTWTLLDAAGGVLHTRALGAALDDDALLESPAFAEAAPAVGWSALAQTLEQEGRPAESLLAEARATATTNDPAPLRARLTRLTLPRDDESARGMAADIIKRADGKLALVANGLPAGADATSLLRGLASSLVGRDLVALAFVDAALLLSPDRFDSHVTRALVNIHLGRPEAARADAAALPADWDEQRAFLEGYARVIFTDFGFAPTSTEISTRFPDVPEGPEQPLETIVAQVQKYATRLGALRAAVQARLPAGAAPTPGWLPPDLSALLPDGPVALAAWEFEEVIEDENAEDAPADAPAPEATLVKVDERLALDRTLPLPSLLRLARREWNGLSWLCWAVGLERVALPTAIAPPSSFGLAAGMSIERLWRCRDRLITGGLRAMTQGVPGFVWEGVEIDLVPGVLAEIAAEEFLEMRAVFYWLCDAGVQSPWQDNLRVAD